MSDNMTTESVQADSWVGFCPEIACTDLGIPADVPARVFRAIYQPSRKEPLDFLGDRLGDRGDTTALRAWLKANMREIQKAFREASLSPASSERVTFTDEVGVFVGTPNSSFGYMYCAAWLVV